MAAVHTAHEPSTPTTASTVRSPLFDILHREFENPFLSGSTLAGGGFISPISLIHRRMPSVPSGASRRPSTATGTSSSTFVAVPPSKVAGIRAKPAYDKRSNRHFVYINGQKHHNYKIPYPLNYSHEVIDLDVFDQLFLLGIKGISFVDFTDKETPKKVLDLGCGTGAWILEAAKVWPDCEFTGFDIVPLQPDLARLGFESLAKRISWVRGNFLRKLPFEDAAFDHVRVVAIAKGVPENMWDPLFEEITRVLCPGGSFEMVEEDILFPVLPRSCTSFPAASQSTVALRPSSQQSSTTSAASSETTQPPHDHALLESLYYSVFESRFINTRPTAILPNCINMHFRQTLCGPSNSFPFPPMPPSRTGETLSFSGKPWSSPNPLTQQGIASPISESGTTITRTNTSSSTSSATSSQHSPLLERPTRYSLDTTVSSPGPDLASPACRSVMPASQFHIQDRALAVHLYRVWEGVLGCREAMWEEFLKRKQAGGMAKLVALGWDVVDQAEDRVKFDALCERFADDMQRRTALDDALEHALRWRAPAKAPLTKAEEMLEQGRMEMRKREQICEEPISRTVRAFCGFKGSKWTI